MAAPIVSKVLEDLETNVTLLDVGSTLVNSLIVFVFVFLFAVIFDFSIYYALLPSLLFLGFSIFRVIYKNKYAVVENKVPELNERLRTVADNVNRTNPILDSLKEDVLKDINKVRMAYFIDYSGITIRMLLLTILSILVIIASFLNVSFDFNLGNVIPFRSTDIRLAGQDVVDLNLSYVEGNLDDILGNRSIAKLGVKELSLIIRPLESDADLNNIKQVSKEDFNAPIFPKEIYTSYDVAYNDRIAKENQKLVKNYFEQISR